MPRLILPLLLAAAAHGLLLTADPAWLASTDPPKVSTQTIRMRLMSRTTHQPSPQPASMPTEPTPAKSLPKKKTTPKIEAQKPTKTTPMVEPVKKRPPEPAPSREKNPPIPAVALPPEPTPPPESAPDTVVDTFEAFDVPDQAHPSEQAATKKKTDHRPAQATNTDKGQHAAAVDHEAVPLYRSNPVPTYPRLARKRGHEGEVLLDVFVDVRGRVEELKVFQSSGYAILDRQALKTVRMWRFDPAKRGTTPVAMWVRVPMKFRLRSR